MALSLLISALGLSAGLAQTQPDLSGTWTMDEQRSGSPTQEGFAGPVVWTIRQASEGFVLTRKRGDKAQEFTYAWQGIAGKADPTVVSPSGEQRAAWDGNRLVIQTLQNIQGKTVTTRETLSLASDGRELTVERVLEVEHGYTMKDAKNFNVVKDVFTRTAP